MKQAITQPQLALCGGGREPRKSVPERAGEPAGNQFAQRPLVVNVALENRQTVQVRVLPPTSVMVTVKHQMLWG